VESGFSGAPSEREDREDVASGWALALAVLRVALERHAGHRRAEVLVMRPALFDESVLPGLQRSREGLGRWLLPALADVPFDGEALEVTAREAVWSWPSVNGVLEVKAFSGGAGRMLALRASAWGAGHGALEALRPRLEHALERLAALVTRS
jgi:hypothetical protein